MTIYYTFKIFIIERESEKSNRKEKRRPNGRSFQAGFPEIFVSHGLSFGILDYQLWKSGSNIQNEPTLTSNNFQKKTIENTTVNSFQYSPLGVYPVEKLAM